MLYRFTLAHEIEGTSVLSQDPKGWDQIELIARRDATYIGMFFDFTIKLDFYCSGGGKEFIDLVYDTYGVDADISITIEMDCNESGVYDELYAGVLDLTTYQRTYTQPEFTTAAIVQKGPIQTIQSRLDTKIDLTKLETIDGTALSDFTYGPYDLNLHSKAIIQTSSLTQDEAQEVIDDTHFFNNGDHMGIGVYFPIQVNLEELQTPSGQSDFFHYNEIGSGTYASFRLDGSSGTVTLKYKLKGVFHEAISATRSYGFEIVLAYGADGSMNNIDLFGPTFFIQTGGATSQAFDISGTVDIPLSTNDEIFLNIRISNYSVTSVGTQPAIFSLDSDIENFVSFTETSTTPATTAKAFGLHEAFARVSQSMVNSTDAFRSNFFGRTNSEPVAYSDNGCAGFTAITNGFQIRQFPLTDRPPFTSFKELFDSCNAIYNLGMGIEQIGDDFFIRVEPKEYFFSSDTLFQIPNIKGFKKTVANDYYFNGFDCGYNIWQQDGTQGVNGLDEFNTKRSYSILLKKIGKKLTVMSDLIGGAYPLELTRRKPYDVYASTNWQYDDDNFIICLNRSVDSYNIPDSLDVAEKDENYPGTSGILDPPSTYNLRISPGRILRRWIKWISPSLIKNNAILKTLKFAFGEGNYKLISTGTDGCDVASGVEVDESANVEVEVPNSDPDYSPLFIPEIAEFQAPLSLNQYKLIKANPTRCIEIAIDDINFIKAFILQVKYQPNKGMGVFSMLLAQTQECSNDYVESGYVECGYVE